MNKRTALWVCVTALVFAMTLIALPRLLPDRSSRFSRRVGEDLFSLELERLNGTLEEAFSLGEGDSVEVAVTRVSGELALSIGQKNREPVYEGFNPPLPSFQVRIPEEGEYVFSVAGKNAAGSVSFRVIRADDG